MNWLLTILKSSIGKKVLMALTGFCFLGFITVHLAGNLTLYAGQGVFNSYASHLHSLGPLVTVFEVGLLGLAVVHVLTGLLLFAQNLNARPVRYVMRSNAGGRTLGSGTMPYTGLLLLAFVAVHLANFHFVDKTGRSIYQIVTEAFARPGYVAFYVFSMIVLAIHVSHGFWSAFQSLGLNHEKYTPLIRAGAVLFSLLVGFGFGLIPLFVSVFA